MRFMSKSVSQKTSIEREKEKESLT